MSTEKRHILATMAGEAPAHVQSFGLKAGAAVVTRPVNSPVTRGQPLVTTSLEKREFNAMHDYDFWSFWADLLGSSQSAPNWIKALWLLIPPAFLLVVIE